MEISLISNAFYTILLSVLTAVFFIFSIFTSYVTLYKTPYLLKAYKSHFFMLNLWYQIVIFAVGIFGRVSLFFVNDSDICVALEGPIQYFGNYAAYVETFVAALGLTNVIMSLFFSFGYRYAHVCHPKSLYSTNLACQRATNAVITVVATVGISVMLVLCIVLNLQVSAGRRPEFKSNFRNATKQTAHYAFCLVSSNLLYIELVVIALLVVAVVGLCCFFIIRVLYTLQNTVTQVSKRTKDMQKMLTITLIVSAAIPTAFGFAPIMLGVYAAATRMDHATSVFRIVFLVCVLEGLLNTVATVFLVKPYRLVLLTWLRLRKSKVKFVTTAVVSMIK